MATDKISEKRFYDLLKKRDKRAMEFLYDSYAPVMYGVIMHITRNEAAAENVLGKTFRYIWKNHREFDPDKQNVCVWIINVARKMCKEAISFHQFTQHNNETAVFSALDKSKLSISGSPAVIKSKKIFDLLFFGNGSMAEVAKHTGMSDVQIKSNLRSATSHIIRISEKVE